jgi:segregation and condensation protein B
MIDRPGRNPGWVGRIGWETPANRPWVRSSRRTSLEWPQEVGGRGVAEDPSVEAGRSEEDSPEERELSRLGELEALLWMAREPVSLKWLAQTLQVSGSGEVRSLCRQLNQRYDADQRAIRVEEVAGGVQLLTRPQFAKWLRRLEHLPQGFRLSGPAMETLAVIAYRQPIDRSEIEAIRGVGCGEVLRQLVQRELVKISGRSEELGRPYLYGTTKRFLQLFGVSSIAGLPRAEWVRQVDARSDRDTIRDPADNETQLD